MYIYLQSEPGLWTVGFYNAGGGWHCESDHDSAEKAAGRVHYLNGGSNREIQEIHAVVVKGAPAADELVSAARAVVRARYKNGWDDLNQAIAALANLVGGDK